MLNSTVMKIHVVLSLFTVCGIPLYLACRNTYKKLFNQKIVSNEIYFEKVNLFKCFNKCDEHDDCQIFNYNEKHQICQLSDKEVGENFIDVIQSSGWDIYFPTMTKSVPKKIVEGPAEVMEFKSEIGDKPVEVGIYNTLHLSTCFWLRPNATYSNSLAIFSIYSQQPCTFIMMYVLFSKSQGILMFHVRVNLAGIRHRYNIVPEDPVIGDTFYHICLVYSKGLFVFYIDSKKIDSRSFTGATKNEVTIENVRVGRQLSYDDRCLLTTNWGIVDTALYDFSLYTEKLSEPAIAGIMKGTYTVSPILSWKDIKNTYKDDNNVLLKRHQVTDITSKN